MSARKSKFILEFNSENKLEIWKNTREINANSWWAWDVITVILIQDQTEAKPFLIKL